MWVVRMDCCSANSTDSYGTFPAYVTTFNISSTVVPFTEANTTAIEGQEAGMETGKIPIYLGGFLSIEGGVWDGSGLLPALELALDHVNARPDVLARYDLRLVWNDSQVSCTSSNSFRCFSTGRPWPTGGP
ncbi:hypothetical protein HOLleu_07275 [Holothuria leucospilota]|uniref:Uncharacterized protein n=1 Tax=Holothuria leucospilota TaxID=206669 RepID=A0A9Q1CFR2_HOLLE|nr:hypothetical protein HOLleu_07275 [Holothuria leucospilota]